MGKTLNVKQGHSVSEDSGDAIREFCSSIAQPSPNLVLSFHSPRIPGTDLHQELRRLYPSSEIVGCTTSGEIGCRGYSSGGITGLSLQSAKTKVSCHLIRSLEHFDFVTASCLAGEISSSIDRAKEELNGGHAFALLLIDGLSVMEEQVMAQLHHRLPFLPIVGGSAGDDLKFEKTVLYHNGEVLFNSAIVILVVTHHEFIPFKTQHFIPGSNKLVITKADAERRIVYEINGEPAARYYATEIGVDVGNLQPMAFSKYPVLVSIGGEYYTRAVQKVNDDESITFYCAIDEGFVLTIARPLDFMENLRATLSSVGRQLKDLEATICFECVLRRMEIFERGLVTPAGELMTKYKVVGFNTYGEQFNAIHINQTLTGVALCE